MTAPHLSHRSTIARAVQAVVASLLFVVISGCGSGEMARETITLGGHDVEVWVAQTSTQRSEGLQAVEPIGSGEGMLFVWDEPGERVFEIKDVEYSVDVIFVAEDGRVVDIDTIEPAGETVASSQQGIILVVEVPGGWAEENGVAEGSRLVREGG